MSIVEQTTFASALREHATRLRTLERLADDSWIYVGTVGLDGVDDLLGPLSPPFENDWTNSLGDQAPVSFCRTLNGWIHIRGGFFGGADGTTIFTLPFGFRPQYQQPMVIPTNVPGHYATVIVNVDGTVVYGTTV